jgi:hypothetical protein
MEEVIEFLETYWGVAIGGGVTFGTLITFIVVQVKSFITNGNNMNLFNRQLDSTHKDVEVVVAKYNQLERIHKQLEQRDKHLERVNVATFKALSYLTMASKLSTEDKLALQREFNKLVDGKEPIITEAIKEAEAIKEEENKLETVEEVEEVFEEIIEEASDLLTKYTESKDE